MQPKYDLGKYIHKIENVIQTYTRMLMVMNNDW